MDIRLIAIDLDGTLLNSELQITHHTIDVLNRVPPNVEVVICTGRTIAELPEELQYIPNIRYIITSNGAAVWNRQTKEKLSECALTSTEAITLMKGFQQFDVRMEVFMLGRILVEPYYYEHFEAYGGSQHTDFLKKTRTPKENVVQYVEELCEPVEKFNLFFKHEHERYTAIQQCIEAGYQVTTSFAHNVEVNAICASKGRALQTLAEILGIHQQYVAAIGDQINDLSMLDYANYPIAMGNAVDEVKRVAVVETLTNREDGVAAAIEQYIIKGEKNEHLFF